jgi:hypothetical protein
VGSFSLLSDWKTVQCDFPPTFKVARGKRAEEYNPKRIPSYTDRILFKSFPGFRDRLDTFAYDSAPGFTSSDHKPIRGMFEIAPSPSVQFASEGGESAGGNAAANGKKGKSAAQATLPEIVFSHIEAKDIPVMDPEALGVGGKADPYIKFYTDPNFQPPSTRTTLLTTLLLYVMITTTPRHATLTPHTSKPPPPILLSWPPDPRHPRSRPCRFCSRSYPQSW